MFFVNIKFHLTTSKSLQNHTYMKAVTLKCLILMMTLEDDQKSRTDLGLSLMINQSREIDELVSYGGEAKILPI